MEQNTSSTSERNHNDGAASRSYDCIFCKRGFTNAQALGGHMNIHRKDKAKVKAKAKTRSSFFPQIAAASYNDEVCIHDLPNPGLQIQTGNYNIEYCFFPVWRPDHMQEYRINGNLSMTVNEEDQEGEVDLELRLGPLL
ncbi:hypothetical protein C2S51_013865 [Perilla frutescens var. frutescens]|nr:hypothetical protein C2S51_013865 [Perilla frutescens var. frutescens]